MADSLPLPPVAAEDGAQADTIRAALDKAGAAPAAAPAPVAVPTVPGAKKKRGRKPKPAHELSQHPDAVRARERRQHKAARRPQRMTPETVHRLTPAALSPAAQPAPALSGPIGGPALTPEMRAAGVKSTAGLAKLIGLLGASIFGVDAWLVSDDDARALGELAVEAHPEWYTHGSDDKAKLLFYGSAGAMLLERVQATRAAAKNRAPAAAEVERYATTEAPAPDAPPPSPPARAAGGREGRPRGWGDMAL